MRTLSERGCIFQQTVCPLPCNLAGAYLAYIPAAAVVAMLLIYHLHTQCLIIEWQWEKNHKPQSLEMLSGFS